MTSGCLCSYSAKLVWTLSNHPPELVFNRIKKHLQIHYSHAYYIWVLLIEAALSEISSYLNPPQMSVRVLYFRYAVESNIARDRIAEPICRNSKIF